MRLPFRGRGACQRRLPVALAEPAFSEILDKQRPIRFTKQFLLEQFPDNPFGEAEVWGGARIGILIFHLTKLGFSLGALSWPGYFCLYIKTARDSC